MMLEQVVLKPRILILNSNFPCGERNFLQFWLPFHVIQKAANCKTMLSTFLNFFRNFNSLNISQCMLQSKGKSMYVCTVMQNMYIIFNCFILFVLAFKNYLYFFSYIGKQKSLYSSEKHPNFKIKGSLSQSTRCDCCMHCRLSTGQRVNFQLG